MPLPAVLATGRPRPSRCASKLFEAALLLAECSGQHQAQRSELSESCQVAFNSAISSCGRGSRWRVALHTADGMEPEAWRS